MDHEATDDLDVQEFPGHIACDAASRSEIVVPPIRHDALIGVLDIDSPLVGRFSDLDRTMCHTAASLPMRSLDTP